MYSITSQTKALKAYPDPNPLPFAPVDAHVADPLVEHFRFDERIVQN